MLRAVNIGCEQSPSLLLSSRRSICRLREANVLRMVVFTRNPFRVRGVRKASTIQTPRKPRDFAFFRPYPSTAPAGFAWLRASANKVDCEIEYAYAIHRLVNKVVISKN